MMRGSRRCIQRLCLRGTILLLVLFFAVACSPSTSTYPMLPGQQLWNQGVSSLLFGTNDDYEWSSQNIQVEPAIQRDFRRAGFTFVPSFIPDDPTNAVIYHRILTIENI